jgi:uncharacterized protein (UPF0332 family)
LKDIDLLIEKAKKALKSSAVLLKEGDFEASVSRSYYAMFYSAQALLLVKNLKFSSHKSVISLFGEYYIKTGIINPEHGKRLSKAFERRIVSDYDFMTRVSEEQAEECLVWAKEFVAASESCSHK